MPNFRCTFVIILLILAMFGTSKKTLINHQDKSNVSHQEQTKIFDSKEITDQFQDEQGAFDSESGIEAWRNGHERRDPAQDFHSQQEEDSSSSAFLCKAKTHGGEVIRRYKLKNERDLKITYLGGQDLDSHDCDLSDCDQFELEKDFSDVYASDDEDFRYMSVEFRSFEDGHRGWQQDVIRFGSQF